MLKCGTLSRKETEQVNERVRRALDEKQRLARSTVRLTGPTPTIPLKTGRYAAENGPARAVRHFAMPGATGRRLKSEDLLKS